MCLRNNNRIFNFHQNIFSKNMTENIHEKMCRRHEIIAKLTKLLVDNPNFLICCDDILSSYQQQSSAHDILVKIHSREFVNLTLKYLRRNQS